MHSSTHLLLLAASLGLAVDPSDCNGLAISCLSSYNSANPNPCPSASVLADINDPCNCSWAFHAVLCYSSFCPGMTQVYYASSAWNDICSGSSPSTNAAMPTSVSGVSPSSSAAAAAQSTGTDTIATVTAAATGTGPGAVGGATTAPASGSGSGSGSSAGTSGSAAPASTSKAWGERSLVLPAGGVMAAVLGLAILL